MATKTINALTNEITTPAAADELAAWNAAQGRMDKISMSNVTKRTATGATTARTLEARAAEVANVLDFGATGDGSTDDRSAIQAAIDSLTSGGIVYFPAGTYLVGLVSGTNDNYGLKVTASNVRFELDQKAILARHAAITTLANAYPILLVGTPDSDVASATENFSVIGGTFQGSDVRHSSSGSAEHDHRNAIELKNCKKILVDGVNFTQIDSSAIYAQAPGIAFDSTYYNKTKVYDLRVVNCSFYATSHAVPGRALIHAVQFAGDGLVVEDNYAEWCDNFVSTDSTYDDFEDKETDTYTDSNLSASVNRSGRDWNITGNTVRNSSEHAFYITGMDATVCGNTVTSPDGVSFNNAVTLANATEKVQWTSHGLSNGDRVRFGSGSLPSELDSTTWYHVINKTADDFEVEATLGGGVVSFSSDGSGVQVDVLICTDTAVKIRARGAVVSGNRISAINSAIAISEPSLNVVVSGNSCTQTYGVGSGGSIDVSSNSLESFYSSRSDYLVNTKAMGAISIAGNSIHCPTGTQDADVDNGIAIRVYAAATNTNIPNGHIRGVNITDNSVNYPRTGIQVFNNTLSNIRGLRISGNTFYGKPFTESSFIGSALTITAVDTGSDEVTYAGHGLSVGDAVWWDISGTFDLTGDISNGDVAYVQAVDGNEFSVTLTKGSSAADITGGTTGDFRKLNALTSEAVVEISNTSGSEDTLAEQVQFSNNTVYGFRAIFGRRTGAASSRSLPWSMVGNAFFYCYQLAENGMASIDWLHRFTANTGWWFPDRSWQTSTAIGNSIGDSISTGERYGLIQFNGSGDTRGYYNNASGYNAL